MMSPHTRPAVHGLLADQAGFVGEKRSQRSIPGPRGTRAFRSDDRLRRSACGSLPVRRTPRIPKASCLPIGELLLGPSLHLLVLLPGISVPQPTPRPACPAVPGVGDEMDRHRPLVTLVPLDRTNRRWAGLGPTVVRRPGWSTSTNEIRSSTPGPASSPWSGRGGRPIPL